MTFLLGRQAMFGQEPPTYLRSMTATFCPWEAMAQARYLPASPLPSTTMSYSSAMDSVTFWYGSDGGRGGRERKGRGWTSVKKASLGGAEAFRRVGIYRMEDGISGPS